jgi:multidrug transporter EmrE-like cation transporter
MKKEVKRLRLVTVLISYFPLISAFRKASLYCNCLNSHRFKVGIAYEVFYGLNIVYHIVVGLRNILLGGKMFIMWFLERKWKKLCLHW